jgi:hypothetical protein
MKMQLNHKIWMRSTVGFQNFGNLQIPYLQNQFVGVFLVYIGSGDMALGSFPPCRNLALLPGVRHGDRQRDNVGRSVGEMAALPRRHVAPTDTKK